MKDYALELISDTDSHTKKLNILREYLQALILRIIQERQNFRNIAFIGGTALRLLHGLPRFSEDLDFSLTNQKNYSFEKLLKGLKEDLIASNYDLEISFKDEKTVQSAFIKFQSLLFEAQLTPMKSQNLSIKLEIDSNPPQGANIETKVLMAHYPIEIVSYDIPSLFAGKYHALLSRKYTKGRDYFDLAWYLANFKNLCPNITLLNNALIQSKWQGDMPTESNWQTILLDTIEKSDWKKVEKDVENFLERNNDLQVFSQSNIIRMLKGVPL